MENQKVIDCLNEIETLFEKSDKRIEETNEIEEMWKRYAKRYDIQSETLIHIKIIVERLRVLSHENDDDEFEKNYRISEGL